LKVLQINSFCGFGSTGRIATDLYRVLEEQGHESIIAYGRKTSPEGINSIRIGSNIDVNLHGIMSRLMDKQGDYSKGATKDFLCKVKEYNPDIIHLHNIHGYYINIELLFDYLASAGKPVVWTLHDCWSFTGHCAFFDTVGCNKWIKGCCKCSQKKEYPVSVFLDNSEKNYEKKKKLFTSVKNMTIVTPSKWLAELVGQSFLQKYPIKVINNGINLDIYRPSLNDFRGKYNLQHKFIVLGVASVWEKRKGLYYFIELSKMLGNEFKIVVVGVTEKQKKCLPKEILGITRTDSIKELAEIYTAADIFVNPTLEDNFPTTNLESLACGTPVITFNTGGSPECLNDTCGVIIEKGNLTCLSTAINEVKTKTKLYYTNACVKKAMEQFDMNNKYQEYLKLYLKLG
jgi:glycosyltransferase involved in cell wall biosynthesis